MKTILHWKKAPFNSTSRIYSAEGEIGQLRENPWKQMAEGELNSRKYQFRTRGFFNQHTEIVDPGTNYIVGKIEYNSLRSSADISYLGQRFRWKYDNVWQTRWSITDERNHRIDFHGRMVNGTIEGVDITEFLVLSGLFVTNYFIQSTLVIFVAIFVPLIATLTH